MRRAILFLALLCVTLNAKADAFPESCSECCGTPDLTRCHFVVLNSSKIAGFKFFGMADGVTFELKDSVLYVASNRKPVEIWAVHTASGAKSRELYFNNRDYNRQAIFIHDVELRSGDEYIINYSNEPFRKDLVKGKHRQPDKAGFSWIPYAALSLFSLALLLLRKRFRVSK